MSKSCQLSVSHINIVHGDENLLPTKEKTSTPTSLYNTNFCNFNDSRRIGIHHSTVTLETGKLDTTFRTRRRGFQDFLSEELDIERPGGICSLAQLVVRDALHLAMSETWELGTSQINYRTLPGNLPHRSRACLNKIFLGRHIYTTIQIQLYNYTNTHESSTNTIKIEGKSPRVGQPKLTSLADSGGEKKNISDHFFSLFLLVYKAS